MLAFFKIIIITIFILIVTTFLAAFITYTLKEKQVKNDQKKLTSQYENILDGANIGPKIIIIDYAKDPISKGSPLIFGGSHTPLVNQADAWKKIDEIGITMIRTDFGINRMVRNTSLDEYINNTNNIQNVNSWDQAYLKDTKDKFYNGKRLGMKTIGIVDYIPPWLSYSNDDFGVPKNWDVYKDLVKKSYIYYRDYLDYVEIWNEPSYDFFLNLTNSNLSREEAYKLLFKTSVEAIREVDKEFNDGKNIKIGGPVSHTPFEVSVLEVILKDPVLKDELDFISYHNYDSQHLKEPSDIYFKELLKKYNKSTLPIFITEWNYSPNGNITNNYLKDHKSLLYTSNKFIDFLNMNIQGANYFSLRPNKDIGEEQNDNGFAFYFWNNNTAELKPQSRSWQLLSKQMALGEGESKIFQLQQMTNNDKTLFNGLGFKNVNNDYGLVLINQTEQSQLFEFNLNNTPIQQYAKLEIYFASLDNDAKKPVNQSLLKSNNKNISFQYFIPKNTIVGVKLIEEKEWYDILRLPIPQ